MHPGSLSRILLAALIIWIAGIVVVQLTDHLILVDGPGLIVGYVITALAGPLTVWAAALIIGCSVRTMAIPTLIIAAVALIADGFVMGFLPTVYTDPGSIGLLAPLFLWTFGWACLSAFALSGFKVGSA